eukprot:CAMPEP_0201690996 /NCGR_PEP_ID=MMETSP0578-20130828/4272_1 /ASSEMBLY_ACC=CAM_ASM_000663 /TAXON_ID=267565 /ORGANISM="Skeletonema grethea, Strain CCMP 1804" /LENGTH=1068 /DNA_ID=CAMNT_0048176103 /DNA_START=182 /DNA_END=3388 /DNA_ORIENTATION=+
MTIFHRWAIAAAAILAITNPVSSQDVSKEQCDELYSADAVVSSGCNVTACELNGYCTVHDSTYLEGKCCEHAGVNVNLLAFEPAGEWAPRLAEFKKCTGANVLLTYVEGGEDNMAKALLEDVGSNDDPNSGQGIYDAYIVQGPWIPAAYLGLKGLNDLIKANEQVIQFGDINSASRAAITYGGSVRALPLDSDNIAAGYRQDLMNKYQSWYQETYNEPLRPPNTIEEMVTISERINGQDHDGDGEPDWGFCLTPQTNYFQAFLAPIFTVDQEDENGSTGQNIFFDTDTFAPLIHNPGYKKAVEYYWRYILASNCQTQTAEGVKCDRKTAFPTGKCFGVISMPGTMTNMLKEGGKYAPSPENRQDQYLKEGEWFGRRIVFPGSTEVLDWKKKDYPLMKCTEKSCPTARTIGGEVINFSPFFSEGGEAYAINGKQSKQTAVNAAWDLMVWFSQLSVNLVPLAGTYRKSQTKPEAMEALAKIWNNTVMAEDLNAVITEYFKEPSEGGNPTQDFFVVGFSDYNDALHTSLHKEFLLASTDTELGLFNMTDPSNSIKVGTPEFEERYEKFIAKLQQRYDEVNSRMTGGALQQLYNWREALDMEPKKTMDEICIDLLMAEVHDAFDRLDCIKRVNLSELCQSMKEEVEAYQPGACAEDNSTIIAAVFGGVIGAFLLGGLAYLTYRRYKSYLRIRMAHEQLMEATINESIRALHQLDYPLHLVRGDEFVVEGKLVRHEVLRNTHKLTVLDSLADVDSFIAAGKHIVFFSHQWTSFTVPDPSNSQYEAMRVSLRELAKSNGWDESLKDVFVWVDYSCIPQANPSTQNLAIRSLAAYASSATYFIIVAPDTKHADLDDKCDLTTYQLRMWCRAEQVCHSMRNGTEGMYLALGDGGDLVPVETDFFQESLHVFDGQLTCCRLEHKGMSACDRQSLVVPLLGLYGELYRAAVEGVKGGTAESLSSVKAFLDEIQKHQDSVFPPTFQRVIWRKNKKVTEEVMLFGDLIERMKHRIDHGQGFSYEEDTGTASTKTEVSTPFIRHGASDFLRHGSSVRHGSIAKNNITVETAVGKLEDHIEE